MIPLERHISNHIYWPVCGINPFSTWGWFPFIYPTPTWFPSAAAATRAGMLLRVPYDAIAG
jgi:hypothetical protein